MKKNMAVIKKCPLFEGIKDVEIPTMLDCLSARESEYNKDEFVFLAGDKADRIGIVLSGSVHVVREDYWGNRTILSAIGPGNLFGEAFSCAGVEVFPVSVLAHDNASVLLIDYKKSITACSSSCVFHARLIQNMLRILADKNVMLTRKMDHITKKTTRDKVLSYLSEQASLHRSDRFAIPFNRQELADYLSVERSALSVTLSKMRKEGLIEYRKNQFLLKQ